MAGSKKRMSLRSTDPAQHIGTDWPRFTLTCSNKPKTNVAGVNVSSSGSDTLACTCGAIPDNGVAVGQSERYAAEHNGQPHFNAEAAKPEPVSTRDDGRHACHQWPTRQPSHAENHRTGIKNHFSCTDPDTMITTEALPASTGTAASAVATLACIANIRGRGAKSCSLALTLTSRKV